MPANMTGPPVLPVLPVTRVVHGVSVAGRYGPVIQIGDPSLIPLYLPPSHQCVMHGCMTIRVLAEKKNRSSHAQDTQGTAREERTHGHRS